MTVLAGNNSYRRLRDRGYPVESLVLTDAGPVFVEGPVEREELEKLSFSDGLDIFRPPKKQKEALKKLAGDEDGMIFIARKESMVVGYATFHNPDFPWWQKTGVKELIELGGLEIDPRWRNSGVASGLLQALFDNDEYPYWEYKIVMNVQTVHCWDLRRIGLSEWKYRELMRKLLEKYGFSVQPTDDPEIKDHWANMLMARVGKNVEKGSYARFLNSCFVKERRL